MTNLKFHAFTEWLAATPLSMLIQNVGWVIPTTQSIHIICISILMGATWMINLRMLNLAMPSQPLSTLARRLLPFVWITLPILLITGAMLSIAEPARSLESPSFQIKMLLLIVIIGLTLFLQSTLKTNADYWEQSAGRRSKAKLLAAASLLIWLAIVFFGRYIAYTVQTF